MMEEEWGEGLGFVVHPIGDLQVLPKGKRHVVLKVLPHVFPHVLPYVVLKEYLLANFLHERYLFVTFP